MSKQKCIPAWYEDPTPAGTYRSLLKWGDPAAYKHPNSGLVKLMLDTFNLKCDDFQEPLDLALDTIPDNVPSNLPEKHMKEFIRLCGCGKCAHGYTGSRCKIIRRRHDRRPAPAKTYH